MASTFPRWRDLHNRTGERCLRWLGPRNAIPAAIRALTLAARSGSSPVMRVSPRGTRHGKRARR